MRINNWLIIALCLVSPSLYAHTGGQVEHSLINGLLHPLTGIDHLLVLLAVGLLAAKHGGKAWAVFPAVFLALMTVGALLNALAVQIPLVESFIALSLLAFGLLVGIKQNQGSKIGFLAISWFAIFHGYAHASEIPVNSNAVSYFLALMLMSLSLCLIGYLLGLSSNKRSSYLFSLLCLGSGWYYLAAG